jgi:hypothetical protein
MVMVVYWKMMCPLPQTHRKLVGEATEMIEDIAAADSKISICSPTEKALATSLETPWHQPKP